MATYYANNPIRTVAPYDIYTSTAGTAVYVPVPSKYQYNLADVSASDSGRTQDSLMHKNRISQKVTLNLEWVGKGVSEVSEILQAFNSEYLQVVYLDAYVGAYRTKIFYVGDRAAPMYNSTLDIWQGITFNLIER